jgi:hypothetical protein
MAICIKDGCGYHSATSAHVDLAIDNNATWQDAFQFGTPTDFTWNMVGQKFEMDVQRTRYDPAPLLHMDSLGGKIVLDDPYQRVIHFNVDPATLQGALSPGVYVYDLIMLDGSVPPVRTLLMHGKVGIGQGVTYP